MDIVPGFAYCSVCGRPITPFWCEEKEKRTMTSIVPEVPPNASVGMRLKAAIAHKGYQTLRAFAAANDLKYETVMSQANDKRRLTEERAESYAPLLDVTPGWLLHGTV